jgi:hypothetical protein
VANSPKHPLRRETDRTGAEARNDADSAPANESGVHDLRPEETGHVSHDHKGNVIWEWANRLKLRRKDDEQVDYVECLGADTLTLDEDEEQRSAFNPYEKK